jgi:hypothetical protein
MRNGLRSALVAALLFCVLATPAEGVQLIDGWQVATPSFISGSVAPPTSQEERQLWVLSISTVAGVSATSVTWEEQSFTRQVASTASGANTEIWTLADPDTSVEDGRVRIVLSGATAVHIGAVQYADVHRTSPIGPVFSNDDDSLETTAALAAPGSRSADGLVGALTGPDDTQMLDLTAVAGPDGVTPGVSWGNDPNNGALAVSGSQRSGGANAGLAWSWTASNPLVNSRWAAAAITVRAPDLAPVTASAATAVTKTGATLGGDVTGDGGGTVTERGVVYCACATPAIGSTGTTKLAAASAGTGAFTVDADGLTEGTAYTARAYAINGGGTSYSASTEFTTVANQPPTANAGGPYEIEEGQPLPLTGSGTDVDDDPLTYSWDIDGDGTFGDATGATPTVPWSTLAALGLDGPASYSVRVQTSDGRGHTTTSAAATLTVSNVAPTASFDGPATVDEGDSATVSFTGVTDPSAADVAAGFRYAFDVDGDGTYDIGDASYAAGSTVNSAAIPQALLADGPATRTVHAAVIDKDDGIRTFTTQVEVANVAPTATFDAPATVAEGESATVSFADVGDASANDLAAGVRFAYDLDGDGSYDIGGASYATAVTSDSVAIPPALLADGPATRTIRAAAIDRDGGLRPFSAEVEVTNVAPTATLEGDDSVPASGLANLTVELADPGDDTVTATLDWGDGTVDTLTGPDTHAVSHTYREPGEKTVTLVATDSDGAEAEPVVKTLTVAAPPPPPPPDPPRQPEPRQPEPPRPPARAPAFERFGVAARCVRPARSGRVRIQLALRLARPGPVQLRIERAVGAKGGTTCPAQGSPRRFDGRFRAVGTYRRLRTASVASVTRRVTLTPRLQPGLYRLTARAHTPGGKLSKPIRRFIRVLE